ncbi:hypothetical protein COX10_02580 [Candidatus Berkelbacteria bacterium CG23_combo_of_CG06-09_8_20_14_all_33_15]|uniref:Uncharacterized protein n=1 Tax=Candidatus Berkelbacteria bacterium CG_4_10_14_0_2_um_filter_35_9_33_12 TaxID=1974499 RepID=A0A2M7W4D3_9BACT|nr:MAG: hypothetical protein COX10_02580 [Candidatus Berkelbacteria bacterium CG23_combo_of_CG06-09_8_20_14_all_33_15]PJA20563.1 MAG: hypothetical protein COX60_01295 [Candidatus Berkelbacteria bacterium CG_4_10_14_0_2_um_filter_35_9_33_12]
MGRDVGVGPVVATGLHSVLHAPSVVHGKGVAVAGGFAVRRERLSENLTQTFLILDPPLRGSGVEIVGKKAEHGSGKLPKLPSRH